MPDQTATATRTTDPARLTELADTHLASVIAAMAGPDAEPRDDQRAAVRALVVEQARVLVVQATGWGKSAVYWAATSALRADGAGPTFVISPLLALMRDQIDAAERAGLRAATVNSSNPDDWDATLTRLADDELDVLLISPERLANPRFARRAGELLARAGLVVIDEAHCISDWGFDFRPDYQRISRVLTAQAGDGVPVLATTATANERVTGDVAAQLGEDTTVLRGTLARSSLRLAVLDGFGPLQRYAWTDRALGSLPGSGIVYVATVAETERLTAYLRHRGHDVLAYSGRLDPAERARTEDALRANEVKAVVAHPPSRRSTTSSTASTRSSWSMRLRRSPVDDSRAGPLIGAPSSPRAPRTWATSSSFGMDEVANHSHSRSSVSAGRSTTTASSRARPALPICW